MSTMMASDTAVPLTTSQKMWLASRFLPVIFFAVIFVLALTILPSMLRQPLPPLLPIFLVVVLLVLIYEASKSLRDLMSGVALVEVDVLERAWHTRKGSRSNRRYGSFTRLGKMQLSRQAFSQSNAGQYRVTYSPATRIVWSLDPV